MALSAATQQALWLKKFNQQLGLSDTPIPIKSDNTGAIYLSNNDAYLPRTKHIDVKHHFIRECINSSAIQINYISTKEMVADSLTKPVNANKQMFCNRKMGLTPIFKWITNYEFIYCIWNELSIMNVHFWNELPIMNFKRITNNNYSI